MPDGIGTNKQILNTCATSVFSVLNSLSAGEPVSLDSVLNEIATMTTGQEIGNAFALAKIDLLTNGISNKLANQYIGNKYMEDSISTTYSSIQQTIREGSPIYSMMDTGTFDNTGTPIAHAVLFTGVTSDGKARYWDPQTDTYESTNDFSKFSGTTKIYIDGEIRVACR